MQFEFGREVAYFLYTIYFPCFIIVIVSWMSFWIDHKAVSSLIKDLLERRSLRYRVSCVKRPSNISPTRPTARPRRFRGNLAPIWQRRLASDLERTGRKFAQFTSPLCNSPHLPPCPLARDFQGSLHRFDGLIDLIRQRVTN